MIPRHMIDRISEINAAIDAWVWGLPLIVLLLGTGVLLTVLTGAAQFRRLGFALREVLGRLADRGRGAGSVTPFEAVATALASLRSVTSTVVSPSITTALPVVFRALRNANKVNASGSWRSKASSASNSVPASDAGIDST